MAALVSGDSNTDWKANSRAYRSEEVAVEQRRCNRFHRVSYLLIGSEKSSNVLHLVSKTELSWSKKEQVFSLANLSSNAFEMSEGVLWVASKISVWGSMVSRMYPESYW